MSHHMTPVSAVVDREVLPGKKKEFEQALKGIIQASQQFSGYLGTDVFYPEKANDFLYRVVFRYQSDEQLKAWEQSSERKAWLKTIDGLIREPSALRTISGLETWFALPKAQTIVPPRRYKMAFITWLALTPLQLLFYFLFIKLHLSPLAKMLISTPMIVLLMTYSVMPVMAKLFSKWLYRKVPPAR